MKKLILILSLLLSSINVSAAEVGNNNDQLKNMLEIKELYKQGAFLSTHQDYLTVMKQKDRLIKLNKVKEDQLAQYCNAARTDIVTGGIVYTLGVPSRSISLALTLPISEKSPIFEKKITTTNINKAYTQISSVIDDGIKQGAYTNQQKVSCLATFNNFITEWNDVNKVARIDMLNTMNKKIAKILINNDNTLTNNIFSLNKKINNCNNLATFFTNQNAIQSTCPGGGSCASPVGGM